MYDSLADVPKRILLTLLLKHPTTVEEKWNCPFWRSNRRRRLSARERAQLQANYSGLALPNRVISATPNHQARKDVCSQISAQKDVTTFETAKHTQTTATAKAAVRTSRDSLHEQELKHITGPIPAPAKRTILRSQETGKLLQTPPRYDTSMELAALIWNSEMHCIYAIVEHHPT